MCRQCLFLLVRDRRQATTAWLSQWQCMRRPFQPARHCSQARTMGSSSFTTIGRGRDVRSHCTWNKCASCHAPHPHEPKASVASSCAGSHRGGGRNETPFHWTIKRRHHAKSERNWGLRGCIATEWRRSYHPA